MCILYFATFDHLYDALVLVRDQFVHLHLVDVSVDFEIISNVLSSKNWANNVCIGLIAIHLLLRIEIGEVYLEHVPL